MQKDKNLWQAILVVSVYILIYGALILTEPSFALGFLMLLLAPALVVWMAIRILRDESHSGKTFDH